MHATFALEDYYEEVAFKVSLGFFVLPFSSLHFPFY